MSESDVVRVNDNCYEIHCVNPLFLTSSIINGRTRVKIVVFAPKTAFGSFLVSIKPLLAQFEHQKAAFG